METSTCAFRALQAVADKGPWVNREMAEMNDRVLILLAQRHASGAARDELLLRHSEKRDRLIGWLARSTEMRGVEVEDAQQNSVFWTLEAIEKYNSVFAKSTGCSFCTFLSRVVACRFKDYLKHLRRRNRHYDWSENAAGQPEVPARQSRLPTDPAKIAEVNEAIAGLDAALERLDGESIRIWRMLGEGCSLRDISTQLGISYDSVKRRRRKLIQHLKTQLTTEHQQG